MAAKQEMEDISVKIPDNVLESKRILGFRRKNIFEGIVLTILTLIIITAIPFVTRIKIIFYIIVGGAVFLLSAIGIKDMSFSELIIAIFNSFKTQKVMHMRSIDKAGKPQKFKIEATSKYTNKSAADKTFDFIKEKVNEFKQNR